MQKACSPQQTTQIDRLEISLPLPHERLHPNASRGRSLGYRASLVRGQRGTAKLSALHALAGRPAPLWKAATCRATFYLQRRRDEDGLIAWLKSTLDGLQDAGIVCNDSRLRAPTVEQITGRQANGERGVVLVLEPIAEKPKRRNWGSL